MGDKFSVGLNLKVREKKSVFGFSFSPDLDKLKDYNYTFSNCGKKHNAYGHIRSSTMP